MSAVKNHPRRSGFDLSNRVCFTSKAGELLPVFWDIVYPGDSFKIKTQLFTRTQPLNTAAYTRIREYLDFYFVPLRLINKNLPTALMQMQDNPVQATGLSSNKIVTTEIPWVPFGCPSNNNISLNIIGHLYNTSSVDFSDFFGFNSLTQSAKLLMYLRYGNFLASTSNVTKSTSVGLWIFVIRNRVLLVIVRFIYCLLLLIKRFMLTFSVLFNGKKINLTPTISIGILEEMFLRL
jgi:hypothetical protein